MFEKIRRKYNELAEKAEKQDIEYIKKHPVRWKIGMYSVMIFYISFSILTVIQDYTFILVIIVFAIPFYVLEKELIDRYKKAMKN